MTRANVSSLFLTGASSAWASSIVMNLEARVLDEPEGRDCESSALVLTGCWSSSRSLRRRRRRVLDEPEGRDCESSALVLTGCLAHQEHCAGAVFLMSPKEEIARVWLWSRLGVLLIKNITRARPQHDVRPGRQRVFLMSSKEEIVRVRPWSRLGVLLIKNLTRARPPLDVRHPNGTHRLGHPAPRAECKHSKSITLWHAVFF